MSTPRGIPRAAYRFFGRFPKPATFLRGLEDYMSASTVLLPIPMINKAAVKRLRKALRSHLESNPYIYNPKKGIINISVSLGTLEMKDFSLTLRGDGQPLTLGFCPTYRCEFSHDGDKICLRTYRHSGMKRSAAIVINFNDMTVTVDRDFKQFLDSHQKEVTPALTLA